MNRARLPWGKRSLLTVLSLGFIVLGIGCIAWAVFSIWAQSDAELNKVAAYSTVPVVFNDPTANLPLYAASPAEGDTIGSLTIPVLKRELPIIQGTGAKELERGVGHFTQSVLPGEVDNCVLSGHRDTVFRQLGKLKIGDQLIVKTSAGTFTYEVSGTRIVPKDDKTVIVPTDHAVLTVTTCYPFSYIGNAPDRYVISAALVDSR